MNTSVFHPAPRWRTVIEEQFFSVWFAIRGVVGVAAALAAISTLFVMIDALRVDEGIPVVPEMANPVFLAALLFPMVVWKGGYHFRRSYLATMPVDQERHVLVKIAAGWIWLMVLTVVFVLLLLGIALVTGGQVGIDEMRVIAEDLPRGISAEEAAAYARRWITPTWQWAVFFTGSTGAYLAGSAVVLASARTRMWLAGALAACMFVVVFDDEALHVGGLAEGIEFIIAGPYGFMNFLTIVDGYDLASTTGQHVNVWSALPSVEEWLVATLLWLGLAFASVVAVIWLDRKD